MNRLLSLAVYDEKKLLHFEEIIRDYRQSGAYYQIGRRLCRVILILQSSNVTAFRSLLFNGKKSGYHIAARIQLLPEDLHVW